MTKRKYPDLEIEITDIDPALAEQWLEKNTHNRNVSDRLVETYAEAMENDEWVLNGEPIIFDRTGKLQSGQHRLLAVLTSGVTIRSVVIHGADPNHLYSLDSGRKRRTTDALTLRGEKNVAILSNALVWTWRYENGVMDRSISPTTTHLMRILDENSDIRDYVKLAARARTHVAFPQGLLATLLRVIHKIHPTDAEWFFEHLMDGLEITSDHPIFALRRWLQRAHLQQRRPNQAVYAAIFIKAWNAYREHEHPRHLRWVSNEPFPEAV